MLLSFCFLAVLFLLICSFHVSCPLSLLLLYSGRKNCLLPLDSSQYWPIHIFLLFSSLFVARKKLKNCLFFFSAVFMEYYAKKIRKMVSIPCLNPLKRKKEKKTIYIFALPSQKDIFLKKQYKTFLFVSHNHIYSYISKVSYSVTSVIYLSVNYKKILHIFLGAVINQFFSF